VTHRTISDWVNDAVRELLAEEMHDLAAFADRMREPARPFRAFVADLERQSGWKGCDPV
jgi:hypothetical protein